MRAVAATVYTVGTIMAACATGEIVVAMVAWMASMLLIASC
jgi:hypothetical protein